MHRAPVRLQRSVKSLPPRARENLDRQLDGMFVGHGSREAVFTALGRGTGRSPGRAVHFILQQIQRTVRVVPKTR